MALDVGVGLGEHGFGVGDALLDLAVLAELFDGGLHVAVLLGDGLKLLLVVDQGGVGHLLAEVFVAGFELVEAVEHGTTPLIGQVIRYWDRSSQAGEAQLGKVVTVGGLGHEGSESPDLRLRSYLFRCYS